MTLNAIAPSYTDGTAQGKKGVSLKYSESSDEPIGAHPEVLVIYSSLLRVHLDERVAHDVLEERTRVDLPEHEAEGVRVRVAEHDKLVAGEGFVEVQLVRRRLVVDKLLVSVEYSIVSWCSTRVDE